MDVWLAQWMNGWIGRWINRKINNAVDGWIYYNPMVERIEV